MGRKKKRINSRAKGARIARKGAKYLESLGFRVAFTEQSNNRGKGNKDTFGLFDAIAVRGKLTVFVQYAAASNRHPDRLYLDWSTHHGPAVQLLYYDKRGFVAHWYIDGKKDSVDSRVI